MSAARHRRSAIGLPSAHRSETDHHHGLCQRRRRNPRASASHLSTSRFRARHPPSVLVPASPPTPQHLKPADVHRHFGPSGKPKPSAAFSLAGPRESVINNPKCAHMRKLHLLPTFFHAAVPAARQGPAGQPLSRLSLAHLCLDPSTSIHLQAAETKISHHRLRYMLCRDAVIHETTVVPRNDDGNQTSCL
ncbi:hypothetical protein IQ07DRAFT_289856 [Pyrenochaeta sp. DS3sAY3a]|nr:hypothetical protein IQ07DRAFT_289856 [Pyrenochaeta sp. DS3sAY3a]